MEALEIYKVYVKADIHGRIYAVTSSAFLTDPTGWAEIDEGESLRYEYAQTQYFGESIAQDGILAQALRENWADLPLGQRVRERTEDEIAADRATLPTLHLPEGVPTAEERLTALEGAVLALMGV